MNTLYLSRPVLACFDNEQPPAPPASEPGPEKRLTQSEVNRIMAEEAEDSSRHSFSGSRKRWRKCRSPRT